MTKKVPQKNKVQEPKAQPKVQAPKGRNKPVQGNALGHTVPEDQSPEPERSGDRSPTGDRVAVNEVNQRARQLPNGWRWVTLREIAQISGGVTKGQKRRPNEIIRKVPYLRVANVQRGYLDLSEVKEIEASESEVQALQLQVGDILFNEGGDRDKLGRGWIWNGELPVCVHQNHVFRARLRDSNDSPKFISFYGNSEGQRYFMAQGKQTTNLASINLTKLGQLPIPLPPPDDQRRIVAEIEKQFTRLEAGVAALRRVQANLKRYRAAVLAAACEGRLVPTEAELCGSGVPPLNPTSTTKPASSKAGSKVSKSPKRQDAASTFESGQQLLARILTERRQNWQGRGKYKEPASLSASGYELASLPEGWGSGTVEQLNQSNRPCAYGVLQPGEDLKDGVPFVRVGDINDGKVSQAAMKRIAPAIAAQYPRTKLHGGELAITLVGAIGRTAVIPDSLAGGNTARAVGIIPLTKLVNPHWVEIWFRNPTKVAEMTGKSHEVARKTLNLEDVRAASVALPPLAEQTRIVAEVERRLSVVEELEAVVTTNLQRATRLRQSILQKAFTGGLA